MKALKTTVCALALAACALVSAQPRGRAPQPITDGLKDAYKDYFKVGVAVNINNVTDPAQIALIQREFNSI